MKPILFSTPMVQAILDGRKTMTRRVVKVEKSNEWQAVNNCRKEWTKADVPCYLARLVANEAIGVMYPKYDVGDILWVRETWQETDVCFAGGGWDLHTEYVYKAGYAKRAGYRPIDKWRPSIFMPKDACRIWLRVTDVRVERLSQMTDGDAEQEGCTTEFFTDNGVCSYTSATTKFIQLWDSLNAKRGYGWDSNPWVWVYSFVRCEKPESEGTK